MQPGGPARTISDMNKSSAFRNVVVVLLVTALLLPAVAEAQSGFALGVAAGDVRTDSAVLWTRADSPAQVRCEVSATDEFSQLVYSETVDASETGDLTVQVEVDGLAPTTEYWYRFVIDGDTQEISAVGRFHTAPPADTSAALRFAFTGDITAPLAPFPIMSSIAESESDFFVFFGDTIYADDPFGISDIAEDLDDYRQKYREVRADAAVREVFAALPLWTGWDDHEVTDNYAGQDPNRDVAQQQVGYQAFFEYMPLERSADPNDPDRIYRQFRWGSNVEFFILDGRQYRDRSAEDSCGGGLDPLGSVAAFFRDDDCAAALREPRTLLGATQLEWLKAGLAASSAQVKFVINDVPISYLGVLPYDRWDGYDAERKELLEFIAQNEIEGIVFLTTDFHSNWYNPDVLSYFRENRPDYDLPGNVAVIEAIVGPVGVPTFHESISQMAGSYIGLPNVSLGSLIGVAEYWVRWKLQREAGFELTDTNRVSYLLVDVDEAGKLSIRYRGVRPWKRNDENAAYDTYFEATQDDSSPTLPCSLPVLLIGLFIGARLAAVRRRGRKA